VSESKDIFGRTPAPMQEDDYTIRCRQACSELQYWSVPVRVVVQ